jgi:hypothetical protein
MDPLRHRVVLSGAFMSQKIGVNYNNNPKSEVPADKDKYFSMCVRLKAVCSRKIDCRCQMASGQGLIPSDNSRRFRSTQCIAQG